MMSFPERFRWLLLRLMAALYDGLVVLALMIGATALLMPFTHGAIQPPPGNLPFDLYLMLVTFSFFSIFWQRDGQTVGMRPWRLRLEQHTGEIITLRQSIIRYLVGLAALATFGLGWFWILYDRQGRNWQDIASGTRLVRLPANR